MKNRLSALVAAVLLVAPLGSISAQQTLTFEEFSSYEVITTQYAGINFQGATILTAGLSLNGIYPPASGVNVVYNPSGPMELLFGSSIDYFQAFFTYSQSLTMQGFDFGGGLLATSFSAHSVNYTGSGNTPNELIRIDGAGIRRVLIFDGGAGNSFVMDDAQFTGSQVIGGGGDTVPEPATLTLLASGLVGLAGAGRRKIRRG